MADIFTLRLYKASIRIHARGNSATYWIFSLSLFLCPLHEALLLLSRKEIWRGQAAKKSHSRSSFSMHPFVLAPYPRQSLHQPPSAE
jgi:hypothetical protein